jgi:hypothetical protein
MKPSAGLEWEEVGFLQRSLPMGARRIGIAIIPHGKKSLARGCKDLRRNGGPEINFEKDEKMFESTLRFPWLYHTFHQDSGRAA